MDFVGEKIYKCGDSLSKIYKCGEVVWSAQTEPDYSKEYLTFEIISSGINPNYHYLNWVASNPQQPETRGILYYSINDGEWIELEGNRILVNTGDFVRVKSVNENRNPNGVFRDASAHFNLYGNVMSLIYGDDFYGKETFPENTMANLARLFEYSNTHSAENLVLPATALTSFCYFGMFLNCTKLEKGPTLLPATTVLQSCYNQMFAGCTSLTTAPELPATIVGQFCYGSMFYNCTSLTTAPELPATTVGELSYCNMFFNCTNLSFIKCFYTNASGWDPFLDWVKNVSPTGTFVKKAGVEWSTGDSGIPSGWTVIEE